MPLSLLLPCYVAPPRIPASRLESPLSWFLGTQRFCSNSNHPVARPPDYLPKTPLLIVSNSLSSLLASATTSFPKLRLYFLSPMEESPPPLESLVIVRSALYIFPYSFLPSQYPLPPQNYQCPSNKVPTDLLLY
ncbi:hypothetical protein WN944_022424 [Citrus x changshan-huyou]|uniref:Uncharacterized protein n=1 Tax=Citrus x changshan-huyou TaxID=2935761 RepID=A0AAP0N1I0_9ROSI